VPRFTPIPWAIALVLLLVFGAVAYRIVRMCEPSDFEVLKQLRVKLGGCTSLTGAPGRVAAAEQLPPATCDTVPKLMLNEICAEGKDCDGREDFVEMYNPADSPADLRCYALTDKKQHRKDLSGTLGAKTVRAWSHSELGFGLSRRGDKVSLIRIRQGGGESVEDSREIKDAQTYQQRIPDGGEWEIVSHQAVKTIGVVGSRNARNARLTPR